MKGPIFSFVMALILTALLVGLAVVVWGADGQGNMIFGIGKSDIHAHRPTGGINGLSVGANGSSVGPNGSSVGANGPSVGANGSSVGPNGPSVGANGPSVGANGPSVGP